MQRGLKHNLRQGFTALELILGMLITTLVLSAMAAFCTAMSTAYQNAGKSQLITLKGNQIAMRINNEVRNARLIGACQAGSSDGSAAGAAVMIWKTDTNNDGYIQGNEVEMIYHDPAEDVLWLYYTGQSDAVGTWSYSTNFTQSSVISQFMTGRSARPIGSGVYGAVFQTVGTSGTVNRPALKYALKLMVNDAQSAGSNSSIGGSPKLSLQYGTATVRAPIAAPSN